MDPNIEQILNPSGGYGKERKRSLSHLWQSTKRSSEGSSMSWLHWRPNKKESANSINNQPTEVKSKRVSIATLPISRVGGNTTNYRHSMIDEMFPSPIPLEVMVSNYAQASRSRSNTYDGGSQINNNIEPSDELSKLFAEVLPVANFLNNNNSYEEISPQLPPVVDSTERHIDQANKYILNETEIKSIPLPGIKEPLSYNIQLMLWLLGLGFLNYIVGFLNISFLWNLFFIFPIYNQLDYYQRQDRLTWESPAIKHQPPNYEFINQLITHLWCKLPQDYLTKKLLSSLNSLSSLPKVSVNDVNIGNSTPTITNLFLLPTDPHEDIVGELSFHFLSGTSPPQFQLQFPISTDTDNKIPCQVNLRSMSGTIRFQLLAPHYQTVIINFVSLPTTDWNIYPLNTLDMMRLPLISSIIKDRCNLILTTTLVHPNKVAIDLTST